MKYWCIGKDSRGSQDTYTIVSEAGTSFIMNKQELLRYIKEDKLSVENLRVD